MDEYKKIVYDTRGFYGKDPGDLTSRRAIRERLQCHDFEWYLKNVHPDLWIPDIVPKASGVLSDPEVGCVLFHPGKPARRTPRQGTRFKV